MLKWGIKNAEMAAGVVTKHVDSCIVTQVYALIAHLEWV